MKKPDKKLTQEYLKSIIHYDPETGIFTWIKRNKKVVTARSKSYPRLGIDGAEYYAHRLAFLYMEGYIPESDVDHINRKRDDNRWSNLRHVSRQCNMRNRNIKKNNRSGITGVGWDKERSKWRVRIYNGEKNISVGSFINICDAAKARWKAEVEHGFPDCNSLSSAYLFLKKSCPNFDKLKK